MNNNHKNNTIDNPKEQASSLSPPAMMTDQDGDNKKKNSTMTTMMHQPSLQGLKQVAAEATAGDGGGNNKKASNYNKDHTVSPDAASRRPKNSPPTMAEQDTPGADDDDDAAPGNQSNIGKTATAASIDDDDWMAIAGNQNDNDAPAENKNATSQCHSTVVSPAAAAASLSAQNHHHHHLFCIPQEEAEVLQMMNQDNNNNTNNSRHPRRRAGKSGRGCSRSQQLPPVVVTSDGNSSASIQGSSSNNNNNNNNNKNNKAMTKPVASAQHEKTNAASPSFRMNPQQQQPSNKNTDIITIWVDSSDDDDDDEKEECGLNGETNTATFVAPPPGEMPVKQEPGMEEDAHPAPPAESRDGAAQRNNCRQEPAPSSAPETRQRIHKTALTELDILCGVKTQNLPQNLSKVLIDPQNLQEYMALSTNKTNFCLRLYSEAIGKGSRFLVVDETSSEWWIVLDQSAAVGKISKSFENRAYARSVSRKRPQDEETVDDDEDGAADSFAIPPPRATDILCGRQPPNNARTMANVLVTPNNVSNYKQAEDRAEFCRSLIQTCRDNGSRFLKHPDNNNKDEWVEVPPENVLKSLQRAFGKRLRAEFWPEPEIQPPRKRTKADHRLVHHAAAGAAAATGGGGHASNNDPTAREIDQGAAVDEQEASAATDEPSAIEEENGAAEKLENFSKLLKELKEKGTINSNINTFVDDFVVKGHLFNTLTAMDKFWGSSLVQAKGLCLLCQLVAGKKELFVALSSYVDKLVALINSAMLQFSGDPQVHLHAMKLINELWDAVTTEASRTKALGLVAYVTVELESTSEDALHNKVVNSGLNFLCRLSVTKDGRNAIMKANCVSAIYSRLSMTRDENHRNNLLALQQRIMKGTFQDFGTSVDADAVPVFE